MKWRNEILDAIEKAGDDPQAFCEALDQSDEQAENMIGELLGMLDDRATLANGHHPREWIDWVKRARELMRSNVGAERRP